MSAPQLSFEFYPPKTPEGATNLLAVQQQLAQCSPEFFSVTFGAGGSTRDKTFEAVLQIKNQAVPAAPHLSCVASTKESIRAILNDYRQHDIRKIVALRGDLPSGTMSAGEFRYANELVSFIRQETGDYFDIHVAAYPEVHPQAANGVEDFKNFQRKVDSGANAAITQYFYNVEAYFEFVNQCEKRGLPFRLQRVLCLFHSIRNYFVFLKCVALIFHVGCANVLKVLVMIVNQFKRLEWKS